jgi:YHS domain-containing protein
MKRAVIAVGIVLLVVTTTITGLPQGRRGLLGPGRRAERVEKARDPVCGILVDKDPHLMVSFRGENYYFCSRADMEKFKKEPERYVSKKR